MKIFIEREEKETELDFEGKIKNLLEKLSVNSEEVLIVKNGEVVTEDEEVTNTDEVKFLSVVSGG